MTRAVAAVRLLYPSEPPRSAREARAFHKRFDFSASPSDPKYLFVLPKDIRALVAP